MAARGRNAGPDRRRALDAAILWLGAICQVGASICVVLIPLRWSASRWPAPALWRWQTVALPVLPWLSLALGPFFAGPPPSQALFLMTLAVAAVALALALAQRGPRSDGSLSPATITARAVAITAAIPSGIFGVIGLFLGLGLLVPDRASIQTEGSARYIVEETRGYDGELHEERWVQDGWVYRKEG